MLTVGLNLKPRVKKGFDSDAQAFFTRVTSAGGTLSATEKLATNQLVLDMKSAGIWSSMKAIYPMVGASAAACAQNLKSSSFTGTFSSGWTFASSGVTPNGTSAYMDTSFNPFISSNGVNDTSLSVYLRTSTIGTGLQTDIGGWSAIGAQPLMNINSNISGRNCFCWDFTTNTSSVSTSDSRGMWGSSRSGASAWIAFERNTAINKTTTNTYPNLPNVNIYLACQNANGSRSEFSPRQIAFSHLGNSLNSTQYNNLYTAVQTFNQTLSRQVGAQIVSDADAQAYINRVYNAGGTLTNTEATAVNQLTIDMKASNVWTSMKAIYPMVGASASACAQNLKSSSFTGTFSSGWTFASTGVTGNGTSAYFNTTLVPSTSLSVNSTHLSLYLNTNNIPSSGDPVDMGSFNSSSQSITFVQSSLVSLIISSRNLGNTISTTQATRQGFGTTSKTTATLTTLYKNGTSVTSGNSGGTLPSFDVYIGTLNFINTPYTSGYTNNKIAFSSIGDGLDNTQASALYTNVQTFNTTLSRQV